MNRQPPHPLRCCLLPAVLAAFLLSPAGPAAAQEPEAARAARIRVQVSRVNVGVIVTDARGNFVEGLRQEDFRILDDGAEQPVANFSAVDEPGQVAVLIESGPAVYLLSGSHLRAASSLLGGLAPGDAVALFGYADRLLPALAFTSDKKEAAAAMTRLNFHLGFGELNLAASLLELHAGLGAVPGKKTIVLLSTGVDTSPPEAWQALLERLRTGDVRVLAVSLSGELRPSSPKGKRKPLPENAAETEAGFAQADARLTAIAEATGGRAFFPRKPKEFAAIYAQIAQLVRHEYSLGFSPPLHDGRMHAIEILVGAPAAPSPDGASKPPSSSRPASAYPGYSVAHRRAYIAPSQ